MIAPPLWRIFAADRVGHGWFGWRGVRLTLACSGVGVLRFPIVIVLRSVAREARRREEHLRAEELVKASSFWLFGFAGRHALPRNRASGSMMLARCVGESIHCF